MQLMKNKFLFSQKKAANENGLLMKPTEKLKDETKLKLKWENTIATQSKFHDRQLQEQTKLIDVFDSKNIRLCQSSVSFLFPSSVKILLIFLWIKSGKYHYWEGNPKVILK